MIIRDASRGEHDAIRELTLHAYGEYAETMAPKAWSRLRDAITTGLIPTASAQTIVAEHGGKLVGSVQLFPGDVQAYAADEAAISEWPEVRLLAVPPESRGLGVARALMAECIKRSRAQGAEYLGLHTSRSMRAAMALYSALGFERAPERDFEIDGAELVEGYRLSLSPASGASDRP